MKKTVVLWAVAVLAAAVFGQARNSGLLRNGAQNRMLNRPSAGRGAAQPLDQNASPTSSDPSVKSIAFNDTELPLVLDIYGKFVGKTVLSDPTLPKNTTITLRPNPTQELTDDEKILAIQTVLEMNGIHLEDYGEKFVRAVPRKEVRKEGVPLIMDPDYELPDTTKFVSLMLPFKNIPTDEAKTALESFKSANGLLVVFERTNSILITDTSANVNRMREIAKTIDIATPVLENVFVRQIKNASAADIQKVLQEIVEDAKRLQNEAKQPKNKSVQQNNNIRPPFGPRRPGQPQQPQAPVNNESLVASVSDADRGMIRGDVLILSDERSNKLIIKSLKSNMDFFDKIIEQLDIETTPDTVVRVYRLKYADAEDVADMINDLIGNAPSSKSNTKGSQNANSKAGGGANLSRNNAGAPKKSVNQRSGETKAGELNKDNTTVLADERINGLVVMTNKELIPTVESIIKEMDIKLSQVLIETVIIEVTLGDDLNTGIDWVNNNWTGKDPSVKGGGGGGSNASKLSQMGTSKTYADWVSEAKTALGSEELSTTEIDNYISKASSYSAEGASPIGSGITYLLKSEKLNLSAVISASKSDSRANYLASPIVMTVDNKEATIEATEARKFFSGYETSSSYSTYVRTPKYDSKDIGITIKVTPKINPNGTVMLEVEEEYSQLGAGQSILVDDGGQETIDTSLTRKMSADVLLENRQTVVLGGLTEKYVSEKNTGVPILKDIPWIGKWLFGSVAQSETRKELLIFMTPYVLSEGDEAELEALRRKKALSDARPWEDNGWSKSKLADPVATKEMLRRLKDEWKKQDEEHTSERELDKAKMDRAVQLTEREAEELKANDEATKEYLERLKEASRKRDEAKSKIEEK